MLVVFVIVVMVLGVDIVSFVVVGIGFLRVLWSEYVVLDGCIYYYNVDDK